MSILNYVVELIQEIHDDEMAIARKRELLATAWDACRVEKSGASAVPSSENCSPATPAEALHAGVGER
ncbi:MAG: hypothetical protein KIT86_16170 [Hydrogenophaga sp.]|jgi:hypothetical protein|uniref:hypothetical protein n=1 Tax=Hydrogenophaga sp. TaxID=1904254 RepID=UPI00262CAA26|nr:hypothetical protein [Hydrogenophaga sp.]MCW5671193.1 hypothetical protein [Hydrogenophaga sp.]